MEAKSSRRIAKKSPFTRILRNQSTLKAIRAIKRKLNPSQRERFEASCFGKLFGISTKLRLSGFIVHQVLSRRADHNHGHGHGHHDEMWFVIGGSRARFSRHEFALVTGLSFGKYPPRNMAGANTRLRDTYFGGRKSITTMRLEEEFLGCEDEDDGFKLSMVYFLQTVLLSPDRKMSIDGHWLSLADDLGSFDQFPWGRVCYDNTLSYLKMAAAFHPTSRALTCPLGGFPFAFMIWAYEAIPLLGSEYGMKKEEEEARNIVPRILRWERSSKGRYKYLQRNVLGLKKLEVLKTLRASELESEQDYMKSICELNHTLNDGDESGVNSDDLSSVFESETFITEVEKRRKKRKYTEDRYGEEKRSEAVANISWEIRGKGKRKSRKRRASTNYVQFQFFESSKIQKVVSEESLNPTQRVDVNETEVLELVNESQKKNNACLQAFVCERLGRENASMSNGDISLETVQCHSLSIPENQSHIVSTNQPDRDLKSYDFEGLIFDPSLNNYPLSVLDRLDAFIQQELDLDFSCKEQNQPKDGNRQMGMNQSFVENEVVELSDDD